MSDLNELREIFAPLIEDIESVPFPIIQPSTVQKGQK